MKTKTWLLGVLVLFALGLITCKKDKPKTDAVKLVGNGSGEQVVPKVVTNGTATLLGNYSGRLHGLVTFTLSFKDLTGPYTTITVNGPASPGTNGPELYPTTGGSFPTASGDVEGYFTIDSIQEKQLLSLLQYFLSLLWVCRY